MYFEILSQLNQILRETASRLPGELGEPHLESLVFTPTREAEHGDLTTNAAMLLAKPLKKPPRDLAAGFLRSLQESPLVEKAVLAGPGFINVHLRETVLIEVLKRILTDKEHYGRSTKYAGQKALVEYVSAKN